MTEIQCVNCERPVGFDLRPTWRQWVHLTGGRIFCDESLSRFATPPKMERAS